MLKKIGLSFVALILVFALVTPAHAAVNATMTVSIWNGSSYTTIFPDGSGNYYLLKNKKYKVVLSGPENPYDRMRFDIEMASNIWSLWHTTSFSASCTGTCTVSQYGSDATQVVVDPSPGGSNYITSTTFIGTTVNEAGPAGEFYGRVDKDGQADDISPSYTIN